VTETPFDDGLSDWFELAARHDGDHRVTTWIPARPDLRDEHGRVRAAALVFAFDSAVGMSAGFAALPQWVVTSDLDARFLAPVTRGPVRAEAVPVRRGRNQVLVEARLFDEGAGGDLVAVATANHGVLTPGEGVAVDVLPPGEVHRQPSLGDGPLPALAERYGVVPSGPGAVELPLSAIARNPWGFLHGSLHVLLAEEAALAVAPGWISGVMVRFVSPVRTGPPRAEATVIGRRGHDTIVRVEVRDAGEGGRVGSLTVLTVSAA
jgi:acyl-coenzyme A thioesterase PaaI-like protein